MTYREQLITNMWKEESRPSYLRLFELDDKRQDSGLTTEEEVEYEIAKGENTRLLVKMLRDIRLSKGT